MSVRIFNRSYLAGLSYEDFFTDEEIDTFRRVKSAQMRLAEVARRVVAEMVNGEIGKGKHFVTTPVGRFRLALRDNSDNETERRDNYRLRAQTVVMGDYQQLGDFFTAHGLNFSVALLEFDTRVRQGMGEV